MDAFRGRKIGVLQKQVESHIPERASPSSSSYRKTNPGYGSSTVPPPCGLSPAQVSSVLKLLLERLRNEITRLPAVKAFTILANSKLDLPIDGALEPAVVSLWPCVRPEESF